MTITRRDVRLVYGSVAGGDVVATLPGAGGTGGPLASGFPIIQGTVPPTPPASDLFLDFNDGTSNATLGINLGGSITAQGQLPYRKHSWVPTGGFDGGGFIRMTWFTGMGIGFSPVQVELPGGWTPHFEMKYQVRQSDTMVHAASAIKLLRLINNVGRRSQGTLEWANISGGSLQRMIWFFEDFAIVPPDPNVRVNALLCIWDISADLGAGCGPKVDDLINTGWHEYKIECNFNDPEAATVNVSIDGVPSNTVTMPPESQASLGPNILQPIGTRFDVAPFAEMYSCGLQGCQATINSGTFDVDHFSYTILP